MAKILSFLGRYICVDDPRRTIEVYRGFESVNVSFSDLGDTQLEDIKNNPGLDIFEDDVWVKCANAVEIDFRKDGLILKTTDGNLLKYKKRS